MGEQGLSDKAEPGTVDFDRYAHPVCLAVLIALGAWIFFTGISGSLSLWDEAYYAATAKKSLERGTILFPSVEAGGRADKTALHFWLLELSFLIFGTHSFALRFPSSLGAYASYLLVYLLGRRFYGARVGLIASLILLTNREFHIYPRNSLLDPPMLAFQLGFVWCSVHGVKTRPWHLALGATLLGLAFFQKQALGLAVVVPVFFYWWRSKEWPRAGWKTWSVAGFLFFVFGCGWYLVAAIYDPQHVKTLLFLHNLSFRFQESGNSDNWYWVKHFTDWGRQGLNPILYMGGFCFIWSIVEWRRKPDPGLALIGFWMWTLTLAIHLVSFRALQYSLPLYPLLALLIARMLNRLWTADWNGVDLIAVGWGCACILLLVNPFGLSLIGFGTQLGKCLIFGTLFALVFMPRWPFHWAARGTAATCSVGVAIWMSAHIPMRADWGPNLPLVIEEIQELEGEDVKIYSTGIASFHLIWHHDGPTKVIYKNADDTLPLPEGEGYVLGLQGEFKDWPEDRYEKFREAELFELVRFHPSASASSDDLTGETDDGGR